VSGPKLTSRECCLSALPWRKLILQEEWDLDGDWLMALRWICDDGFGRMDEWMDAKLLTLLLSFFFDMMAWKI